MIDEVLDRLSGETVTRVNVVLDRETCLWKAGVHIDVDNKQMCCYRLGATPQRALANLANALEGDYMKQMRQAKERN